MKVDFSGNFKDYRGVEMKESGTSSGKSVGTSVSISDKVAESLFVAGATNENRIKNGDKFAAYKLSKKIVKGGIVDITTEEATLIKSIAADYFTAGIYGQIVELIESGD